ncbi:hypothetical protein [Saccharopolyspora rosea]|uniref:Uncharacterized protein n=1 Tax=Saccharopolyspora rosea TaxID=524884 RepID=A0ABW3FUZ6_9PSEU|nr:hypothetical protein [Saccharopolyspora rosea]
MTINGLVVLAAAALAGYLARHPRVLRAQRFASGTLLGFLAAKMATSRPN